MDRLFDEFRRVTAGQTQEQIAARLGIDQTTVSGLLAGKHRVGRKVARSIIRVYPELREAVRDAYLGTLQLSA